MSAMVHAGLERQLLIKEVLQQVPPHRRESVEMFLKYVFGATVEEIAAERPATTNKHVGRSTSAVRSHIQQGRRLLWHALYPRYFSPTEARQRDRERYKELQEQLAQQRVFEEEAKCEREARQREWESRRRVEQMQQQQEAVRYSVAPWDETKLAWVKTLILQYMRRFSSKRDAKEIIEAVTAVGAEPGYGGAALTALWMEGTINLFAEAAGPISACRKRVGVET